MGALVWLMLVPAGLSQTPSVTLQQAAGHLKQGNPAAAIALLEPGVREHPADQRALTLLGMALSAASRGEEANQRFRAALALNPAFAPALRGLAMNEMAMNRVRDAKDHFEALLKLTPEEPVAHLALGEIYFHEKKFALSVRHYDGAQGLHRQDPQNLLRYAGACLESGQPRRAVEVLAQLPDSAGASTNYEAGLLLAKAGGYAEAAGRFEHAIAKGFAGGNQAAYNLALAQLRAKNYAGSARTLEQLIARGYRNAEAHNLLAQAYEKSGRTKLAYDALRTATEIDPADETNYLDLIALSVDHKNYDLAIEIADVGLKRMPGSDRLHLQRGVVRAMKGQLPEAREAFERAAQLAPSKGLPQVAAGLVLIQMDQPLEAAQVLRRRASKEKNDYLVLWFLAEALSRAGVEPHSVEGREAMAAAERSVKLKPDVAEPRILLAKMMARAGAIDAAVGQLDAALGIDPGNTGAMYQLAQLLNRKGESARAKALFDKVAKMKAGERDQFATQGLAMIVREGAR